MSDSPSPRIRVIDGRVWVLGVGSTDPLVELIPSHPRWKRKPAYWRVAGSRRWSLTPALALKSWLADPENRA